MNDHDALRGQLLQLLDAWESSMITADVHGHAEVIWEKWDYVEHPEHDPASIPVDVLDQLSNLDVQYITRADIPEIRRFLATPAGQELAGWRRWVAYWDQIDYEQRKIELRGNPVYRPGADVQMNHIETLWHMVYSSADAPWVAPSSVVGYDRAREFERCRSEYHAREPGDDDVDYPDEIMTEYICQCHHDGNLPPPAVVLDELMFLILTLGSSYALFNLGWLRTYLLQDGRLACVERVVFEYRRADPFRRELLRHFVLEILDVGFIPEWQRLFAVECGAPLTDELARIVG